MRSRSLLTSCAPCFWFRSPREKILLPSADGTTSPATRSWRLFLPARCGRHGDSRDGKLQSGNRKRPYQLRHLQSAIRNPIFFLLSPLSFSFGWSRSSSVWNCGTEATNGPCRPRLSGQSIGHRTLQAFVTCQ